MRLIAGYRYFLWLVFLLSLVKYSSTQDDFNQYPRNNYQHSTSYPIYQPRPVVPAPAPRDPSVILVPRIGHVKGIVGYRQLRHRSINAFLGLKYGNVGTGLARFQKASAPVYQNYEVIDATHEPANCPQFPELEKVRLNEERGINTVDCLTLNIFTPNKTGYFPVMVFVHGEMLFDGEAAEAQPDYLLEHDVVLVTLNYRLAPFGFLTTLTDQMPGNVALSDIHLALQWVNQYIPAFGGNPQLVTLFGQAGGATLVHALSLSGKAESLFHKLILQSGTALNPYFIDNDSKFTARTFAHLGGCSGSTEWELNTCFERLSTVDLLRVFERHWDTNEPHGLSFTGGFKLTVGDKLGYLPVHPAALVANNKYPTIAGVTKDAGAFFLARFYNQLNMSSHNASDYINVVLRHISEPRFHATWRQWALSNIFTENDILMPTAQTIQGLLELINFVLYRGPIIDSLRYTYQHYPTFLYCFDYRGEFHRYGHLSNPLPFALDAELSDDSLYLFPYPREASVLNAQDLTIARAITTMWYNFALHGNPNQNPGVWSAVSSVYGPFLRVTNNKERTLEHDHHFGEGIVGPNLYPEYFTTTTTTTTRRTPLYYTTAIPSSFYEDYPRSQAYNQNQQQYRPHQTVLRPGGNNYHNGY